MNTLFRNSLTLATLLIATQAAAQITFYEEQGFAGRSFSTDKRIGNFERNGFNDRASSLVVQRDRWEVCEDAQFRGRCIVLRPGRYPSLADIGLNERVSSARKVGKNDQIANYRYAPVPVAGHDQNTPGQVTFYEHEGFSGRSFTTLEQVGNFQRSGFNDRASSVMVQGGRWEVCENARFSGRCVVLRPGRYPSLAAMGLNDRVSSVRSVGSNARIDDNRYAPPPVTSHDYRRVNNERLYAANVTSVRAVVGPPEQRCWVEREQVIQDHSNTNIPGAIAGAVIGGILGHQVGAGSGKDLATAGGAVAGGLLGANFGRDGGGQVSTQNVQRCTSIPSQEQPDYWDVTYNFHGQEHRLQMTTPPGNTVTVNERGEPRT